MAENQDKLSLSTHCPTCGLEGPWHGNPARPFCSLECKLIDLGVWLDERYRVPGSALRQEAQDAHREE